MSASNVLETGILNLILQNSNLASIGDATGLQGSATAGDLYITLHVADPGEGGFQTTNECTYTSYDRVAVVRSGAGFSVVGDVGSNAVQIQFPVATGGTETATHFGIGTANSGVGTLLFSDPLTAELAITTGIQPTVAIGTLTITAS